MSPFGRHGHLFGGVTAFDAGAGLSLVFRLSPCRFLCRHWLLNLGRRPGMVGFDFCASDEYAIVAGAVAGRAVVFGQDLALRPAA